MSPRAAARLEALGFEQVYDYAAGKADWGGRGLPLEGSAAPWAVDAVREAPTARPDERLQDVRRRVGGTTCVVVDGQGIVLGLLGRRALARDDHVAVEVAMSEGPRTFRPDTPLADLQRRLRERGLTQALITTLDGRLVGFVALA